MSESYVELMWRVVKNQTLVAGFADLDHAMAFAKQIGAEVVVVQHKLLLPM